jgi:hypothetical protein
MCIVLSENLTCLFMVVLIFMEVLPIMKTGDKRNYKQKGIKTQAHFSKNQIKQTIEKGAYNESAYNNKDGEQFE